MSTDKDDIELLMARVEQMRQAQRDYFTRKMTADKKLSIALEGNLDELLKQYRRKGYNPDRFKTKSEQQGFF